MHQYLDSDGSGTSPTCVSSTIGAERLQNATAWLQQNNLKGFLGEIGAGSNAACITAIQGALCEMQQSGVWLGALWWAAGPWWGDVSVSSPLCCCFQCLGSVSDERRRVLTRIYSWRAVLPEHRAPERHGHRGDPPAGARAVPVKQGEKDGRWSALSEELDGEDVAKRRYCTSWKFRVEM